MMHNPSRTFPSPPADAMPKSAVSNFRQHVDVMIDGKLCPPTHKHARASTFDLAVRTTGTGIAPRTCRAILRPCSSPPRTSGKGTDWPGDGLGRVRQPSLLDKVESTLQRDTFQIFCRPIVAKAEVREAGCPNGNLRWQGNHPGVDATPRATLVRGVLAPTAPTVWTRLRKHASRTWCANTVIDYPAVDRVW